MCVSLPHRPDSPTSPVKDVSTHTRALKLKHQALEESLELCLLELRKLCIREAVGGYYIYILNIYLYTFYIHFLYVLNYIHSYVAFMRFWWGSFVGADHHTAQGSNLCAVFKPKSGALLKKENLMHSKTG